MLVCGLSTARTQERTQKECSCTHFGRAHRRCGNRRAIAQCSSSNAHCAPQCGEAASNAASLGSSRSSEPRAGHSPIDRPRNVCVNAWLSAR